LFIDARNLPDGTTLTPDIAIIGGGPAGISFALALADARIDVAMFESGGMDFDAATQDLYDGTKAGVSYLPLAGSRLRYLGGSTNHWGGWCRPLDEIDFEQRAWLEHSGWPITRKDLLPYFPRAQSLVEAGPFLYDKIADWVVAQGQPPLSLGDGGVYTSWFQFSKTRDSLLPTHFGQRYAEDLKRVPRLKLYFHANATKLGLASDAKRLDHIDMATLSGRRFSVKPKYTVLATGAMENARLLLVSNDVDPHGIGNSGDMVGRFFADHPIPRDTATLVVFDGKIANYYGDFQNASGAVMRATFAPRPEFQRSRGIQGSLSTVENEVPLDAVGKAAVAATASALGVDGRYARAFSLGCGLELAPDPGRRLTLTGERDALGLPRLKLNMSVSSKDFQDYRDTLKELGRQLLVSGAGMIRLNRLTLAEWLDVIDWGNHHMGTTRMSDTPRTGVVDRNAMVHGVSNLFVAGSSIFPTYGASNPTLNLIALTLRLADRLRSYFR
jgi:choline dehydrogenase-like flavoprotein